MINRKFFFDYARLTLFGGKLTSLQVSGMTAILDEWESKQTHNYTDNRHLAYMLATTFHETDKKMQPIEEYGKGRGRAYGRAVAPYMKIYYGRGYVQLTWLSNYQKAATELGVDFVKLDGQDRDATSISWFDRCLMHVAFSETGKALKATIEREPKRRDWLNDRALEFASKVKPSELRELLPDLLEHIARGCASAVAFDGEQKKRMRLGPLPL